tara:strand:+ start:618 stop:1196 length:579 start_codon:yes stop_codon:yes gene_type:complete
MYEVYDNILTIDEQNVITNILFDSNFPYYFINSSEQKSVSDLTYDELSDKNTVESKVMVHNFIHNAKISRYYEKIEHILQKFYEKTKIKFFDIIRCKLNLQYQVADYDKNNYQCPHMDQNYDHKVLIYYPYTSDGDTFLFERLDTKQYKILDRIEPIGGRFLLMDKMFHAGQPPIKNETRMTLNYNLIGVYK